MPSLGFPSHVPTLQTPLQQNPPPDQPSGGWLTDSDTPRRTNTLKIVALAAILATDPVLSPLSIKSTIAYASSGQVSINTWKTYDPTTGPVSPPPAVIPVLLPDATVFSRLRWKIRSEETTAPIGVAPGQFLQNFVAQWSEHAPFARRKPNQAANASSTSDSIRSATASITSTVAFASSGAIAVNSWSVYDPTTGPVLPPAPVAVRPLIDSPSDIVPRRRKIWLPQPTSVVVAIPVDDLWFESLDVPVRIKSSGRLAETVAPVSAPVVAPTVVVVSHWLVQSEPRRTKRNGSAFASATIEPIAAPASATIGTTFVGASSSQVVVYRWSIHDQTTGPVFPPPPAAPTVVVSAHWLVQSQPSPIRWNKAAAASATIDPIKAPPSATIGTTFVGSSSSQIVLHRWSIHDQTTGPVLPLVSGVTPPDTGGGIGGGRPGGGGKHTGKGGGKRWKAGFSETWLDNDARRKRHEQGQDDTDLDDISRALLERIAPPAKPPIELKAYENFDAVLGSQQPISLSDAQMIALRARLLMGEAEEAERLRLDDEEAAILLLLS